MEHEAGGTIIESQCCSEEKMTYGTDENGTCNKGIGGTRTSVRWRKKGGAGETVHQEERENCSAKKEKCETRGSGKCEENE